MKKILVIVLVLFCGVIYFIQNKSSVLLQAIENHSAVPMWGIIFVGMILLVTTIIIQIAAYKKSYKLMLFTVISLALIFWPFMVIGMAETQNPPSYILAISLIFLCPVFSFIFSISGYSDQNFNLKRKSNFYIALNLFFLLLLCLVQIQFSALYFSAIMGVIIGVIIFSLLVYIKKKRREKYLIHK
jgi:hypothetical protein